LQSPKRYEQDDAIGRPLPYVEARDYQLREPSSASNTSPRAASYSMRFDADDRGYEHAVEEVVTIFHLNI
jgi:hypothetical protein